MNIVLKSNSCCCVQITYKCASVHILSLFIVVLTDALGFLAHSLIFQPVRDNGMLKYRGIRCGTESPFSFGHSLCLS